jgi:hypothetical protein
MRASLRFIFDRFAVMACWLMSTLLLRIMRYKLADYEWAAIKPMLPNKPRGVDGGFE